MASRARPPRPGRRRASRAPRHADAQRHQRLLGAVVQVALQPAALLVGGRRQPGARRAQLSTARRSPSARSSWRMAIASAEAAALSMSGVSPSDGRAAGDGRPAALAGDLGHVRGSSARRLHGASGEVLQRPPRRRASTSPVAQHSGERQPQVRGLVAGAMLSSSVLRARALRPWSSITATVITIGSPKRASPRSAMNQSGSGSSPKPRSSGRRQGAGR